MTAPPQLPLTNLQQELLKVFTRQLPEESLQDIRRMIAAYLLQEARNRAAKISEEKGYTPDTMRQWINEENDD